MSDFDIYPHKHMTAPSDAGSPEEFKEHLEQEYRRLRIDACRVYCETAEDEMETSGSAEEYRQTPDFWAALLLTTYFHRALGPDFDPDSVQHWDLSTDDKKKAYQNLNVEDLTLLRRTLEEGRKLMRTRETTAGTSLTLPEVQRVPIAALEAIQKRIDIAAEILEAVSPGAASTCLGAVKIRYFLPDDLWNGPEMRKDRIVLDMIFKWDSYIPVDQSVRSIFIRRMRKMPDGLYQALGPDSLSEPFPPPLRAEVLSRMAAEIALLAEQSYEDFPSALTQAPWFLVYPNCHHLPQAGISE